ncbi:integrase [Streptomyces bryophytorum]|uniref:Phage integrase family domain protein n=1 Tax=Actinacidiphila bryophytorum TaxID=1436133 RepID=A0A9W4GW79_9ACTN|nr:integrase [Actinacidiphila bryophytorum]CAG7603319.1 Phage integrase family domain protein [Actinacidiphila bryophytorum]
MTIPAHLQVPAADSPVPWPDDDVPVLRNRPVRLGTDTAGLSRFGDDVWNIRPAHRDAHTGISSLNLLVFPKPLRRQFRTVLLAALDHPQPVEPTGLQRSAEYIGIGSMPGLLRDLQLFARWMHSRGFRHISNITDHDLDTYLSHVLGTTMSLGRKADVLGAVRTLWLFRDVLPIACRLNAQFPWPGRSANELVGLRSAGGENKRPRIHDATMEALLAWSLLMVEQIGPDVRDAWHEYTQLCRGEHPSQAIYSGTAGPRLHTYVDFCRRTGTPLPGTPGPEGPQINYGHVLRLIGLDDKSQFSPTQKRWLARQGLVVAERSSVGAVTGQIQGRPWRDAPLTVGELPGLWRRLNGALFTVVCYLSGMRPGEVLSLRRGCRGTDEATGQLVVHGHRGKGYDRAPDTPDRVEPARPWVVVDAVHDAIALLESLHDQPYLFPAQLRAGSFRPSATHARTCSAVNRDIADFAAWVNQSFRRADGSAPIPDDPAGKLNASRFRRTLARFIVRRPRGLIAAALQYGHVDTKVTLNYAGAPDTEWLQDVAVEKLELILEQISEDAQRLAAGEHVSGPSADEYRRRVTCAAEFPGRTVISPRSAARLLAGTDPQVHHGEGMTCVWRPETAACRASRLAQGLPEPAGPEESECRSSCTNLAFTDRDIAHRKQDLRDWEAAASDPLTPRPLRDRATAQAERITSLIRHHEQDRTEGAPA